MGRICTQFLAATFFVVAGVGAANELSFRAVRQTAHAGRKDWGKKFSIWACNLLCVCVYFTEQGKYSHLLFRTKGGFTMLRYTFLALAVFAFTISLLIPSGDAAAQGCPPGGGDEMDVANVKYTKDPASLQNVRGIVFDVRWENCTGIDRVEARVIDKATGKQLAAPYFKTIDVTATKSNWQIQLPMSKQNDWVQVTVYALDSTGAEIAKSPTKEVKLLK